MNKAYKYVAVLTIAGSDSGGGAGIQADLKTFSALGCYGTSAITAVTVQNTLGITGIHNLPTEVVREQIVSVVTDITPAAIKIGMVPSSELTLTIASVLKSYPGIPVVFDPVLVSTSGRRLAENNIVTTLKKELFPVAQIVTPNMDEAEVFVEMKINTVDDMKEAAGRLIQAGCNAVLVKGGHMKRPTLFDVYRDRNGVEKVFRSTAVETQNSHGTGCTLSSAIASFVALGNDMITAIDKGKAYVHQAIVAGQDVQTGNGSGPLNHFFDPLRMKKIKL